MRGVSPGRIFASLFFHGYATSATSTPVSYTHLDVYKRQGIDGSTARHKSTQQYYRDTQKLVDSLKAEVVDLQAVSYTHLDVYKRQGYTFAIASKPSTTEQAGQIEAPTIEEETEIKSLPWWKSILYIIRCV